MAHPLDSKNYVVPFNPESLRADLRPLICILSGKRRVPLLMKNSILSSIASFVGAGPGNCKARPRIIVFTDIFSDRPPGCRPRTVAGSADSLLTIMPPRPRRSVGDRQARCQIRIKQTSMRIPELLIRIAESQTYQNTLDAPKREPTS